MSDSKFNDAWAQAISFISATVGAPFKAAVDGRLVWTALGDGSGYPVSLERMPAGMVRVIIDPFQLDQGPNADGLMRLYACVGWAASHGYPFRNADAEHCAAFDDLEAIAEQHGLTTLWSVDGVRAEDMGSPHPWAGAWAVCYRENLPFQINGTTWLDLWKAADATIKRCGPDDDHRFIEAFERDGDTLVVMVGS